jgi:hypothetical protein
VGDLRALCRHPRTVHRALGTRPPGRHQRPTRPPAQGKRIKEMTIFHSVLRIRDVYPRSRIRLFSIPDPNCLHPGYRIRIKEFKYFNPKKWFLSSRKNDPGCSSRIPGHKSNGSRIRIRDTAFIYHYMFLAWAMRCAKNEL